MGQPPLDTSRPDLSRPRVSEPLFRPGWYCGYCERAPDPLSPEWRMAGDHWQHYHGYPVGHVPAHHPELYPEPCSPPASQPAAELAEPSAPSQEGSGSAGGAELCCQRLEHEMRQGNPWPQNLSIDPVEQLQAKLRAGVGWLFCHFCGAKLGEGE